MTPARCYDAPDGGAVVHSRVLLLIVFLLALVPAAISGTITATHRQRQAKSFDLDRSHSMSP
jgi:hypothetical protein